MLVSGGNAPATAARGSFSGRSEVQYAIFDQAVSARMLTLRILAAVGGISAIFRFKPFRR